MDCLLLSGFPNTGKNLTTVRVAHFLLDIGYLHDDGDAIPARGTGFDFLCAVKHPEFEKRILINTRSDYERDANQLTGFYRDHEPIDIVITTIRDAGSQRDAMDNAIRQLEPVSIVEVPLARIIGQRSDWQPAFNAYLNRLEDLARFVLRSLPYQVQNP